MRFEAFSFGSIRIDGVTYEHDVVIDRGTVRKRKKKPSRKYREQYGHTPLSVEEDIPWKCRRLVIGSGTGALPVMDEVKLEALRRRIELLILPTRRGDRGARGKRSEGHQRDPARHLLRSDAPAAECASRPAPACAHRRFAVGAPLAARAPGTRRRAGERRGRCPT
ncbi:MAG: hypothetical protein AB1689_00390 [Thermodesulfobacteriota bacterium]